MTDSDVRPNAIEDLWRARLRDAKLRLDFARQYVKEVEDEYKPGDLPASDAHFAMRAALRAETFALTEYRRILRIFADLVLEGKCAAEPE